LYSLFLSPFGMESVTIFYPWMYLDIPHRTGLVGLPHPALQEHILNARIEYRSDDISLVMAKDCTLRSSGTASSCSFSSDCACLSIYAQASSFGYRMPALLAYCHLCHSSDSVRLVYFLILATIALVLLGCEHSSATGSFPSSYMCISSLPSFAPA